MWDPSQINPRRAAGQRKRKSPISVSEVSAARGGEPRKGHAASLT